MLPAHLSRARLTHDSTPAASSSSSLFSYLFLFLFLVLFFLFFFFLLVFRGHSLHYLTSSNRIVENVNMHESWGVGNIFIDIFIYSFIFSKGVGSYIVVIFSFCNIAVVCIVNRGKPSIWYLRISIQKRIGILGKSIRKKISLNDQTTINDHLKCLQFTYKYHVLKRIQYSCINTK